MSRKTSLVLSVSILFLRLALQLPKVKSVKSSLNPNKKQKIETGDILFQGSTGGQGLAIQIATGSKYSHCGIAIEQDGEMYVLEAVQPVRIIPLSQWIKQGDDHHYVAKRIKGADTLLTDAVLSKMKQVGQGFVGKNYDLYFGWNDDLIYCSELVWKIYERGAGLQVGELQKLKDFKLDHPVVQQKLKERYGSNIPYNELVISPGAIFESDQLITIFEN